LIKPLQEEGTSREGAYAELQREGLKMWTEQRATGGNNVASSRTCRQEEKLTPKRGKRLGNARVQLRQKWRVTQGDGRDWKKDVCARVGKREQKRNTGNSSGYYERGHHLVWPARGGEEL